ncbi:hypothetical protein [Actinomadura rugatobispora]|uniref:Single-stranded DNA-binding protein n=1 Tax=Actinomadura rugatobispora TaxID=1994 RepID=A0ABW0ZV45_9ACTN|nr:hypothetical protein GCM10010200_036110 [Actinomadura rugatobispora]
MTTANDFLMAGGTTSAKFPAIGTTVTGTIAREPEVQQQKDFQSGELKYWNDGKPMQQLMIVLATDERDPSVPDDDGERAVYVKGQMQKAVKEAIRKSSASGIAVGGTLTITYTADGEAKRGFNPPKVYTATYAPPSAATDFLNSGNSQEQQPAAPQAAPAPAAPAGVTPEALAALAQLTPEQKAALGIG